ncbi:hypothetical protein ACFQWB_13295 [Paenibacillus thermoaerophilus]|uniref:Uncharacterized protein n=1 Tax=Paenibacillus thermoaerophilus TaxID=1215385 RepID=A0ABW2V6P4_9BACL|nr:hypothetical protein [Paenibacillus thermoaerophilus]
MSEMAESTPGLFAFDFFVYLDGFVVPFSRDAASAVAVGELGFKIGCPCPLTAVWPP